MPSTVQGIVINRIGFTGVFNIGDAYELLSQSKTRNYHGSGSSNTGISIDTFNGISETNVVDTDKSDQNVTFTP